MTNGELKYLKYYLPNYSNIQKKIYLDWKNRIEEYYKLDREEISSENWDKVFFTKNLKYFFPYLCLLENPFHLPDMEKGIKILRSFYEKDQKGLKQKIVIYGDRDTDGVVSASIIYHFFQHIYNTHEIKVFFPLKEDKYGITDEVGKRIFEEDFDLLIVLDCGSSNAEELKKIKNSSNSIIIMDHHTIPEKKENYPEVDAFINPKKMKSYEYDAEPATSGIAFKFIWAFVYSFTSVYRKKINVRWNDQFFVFYHGQVFSQEKPKEDQNIIDLNQYWDRAIRSSKRLRDIDRFIKESGHGNDPRLPYLIYENDSMRNVRKKIISYLPFSAIGSIVDMMPVIDDNKIIISEGLRILNKKSEIAGVGLESLLRRLQLWSQQISESDISFFVGPVINAPGRLDIPDIAFELLVSDFKEEAAEKAFRLIQINQERKKFSKDGYYLALSDVKIIGDVLVTVYHPEIHPGISGLVANKIADLYKKPTMVMVKEGPSIRGSIRAWNNENVFELLHRYRDFFIQYGGHKGAAGFSIEYEQMEAFLEALSNDLQKGIYKLEITEKIYSENFLDEKALNSATWQDFLTFSPYGVLNPHPETVIRTKSPVHIKLMGEEKKHARVIFDGVNEKNIEGVWFFHNGDAKQFDKKENLSILAEPHYNYFRNERKYQLKIKKVDIASN